MKQPSISIKENLLPQDLIDKLEAEVHRPRECRTNITNWDSGVVGSSSAIILFDIAGELKQEVWKWVEPLLLDTKVSDFSCVYTVGTNYSFIPWHDDHSHCHAVTIYLNKEWDKNWGGALLYAHRHNLDDIRAIYPKYNQAVVMKPPIHHSTMMTAKNAPMRLSLQIFTKAPV